jgi:hypothetical protein
VETVDHSSGPGACEFAGETPAVRESLCFYRSGGSRGRPGMV